MENQNSELNLRAGFAVGVVLAVPIILATLVIVNAIREEKTRKEVEKFMHDHVTVVNGVYQGKEESTEK